MLLFTAVEEANKVVYTNMYIYIYDYIVCILYMYVPISHPEFGSSGYVRGSGNVSNSRMASFEADSAGVSALHH